MKAERSGELSRRDLLRGAALASLAPPLAARAPADATLAGIGLMRTARGEEAYRVRVAAADVASAQAAAASSDNGDEKELPRYVAMYSKGLPHNALGEVAPDAYAQLLRALRTGSPHWRSDVEEGLRLGEDVAIRVLREVRLTTHEPFGGFRFHRLDGRAVTA